MKHFRYIFVVGSIIITTLFSLSIVQAATFEGGGGGFGGGGASGAWEGPLPCTLTSASWGAGTVTTGQPVQMYVRGQNCNGWTFSFNVYEEDTLQNDYLGNVIGRFANNTDAQVLATFYDSDYESAGNEVGGETIYFMASANNMEIESSTVAFQKATTVPPPTTDSGTDGGLPLPGDTTKKSSNTLLKTTTSVQSPGTDLTIQKVFSIINALACWVTRVALLLIIIALVYYGLMFLWARGDPTRVTDAKKAFGWGLVGVIVILSTYTIIATVANSVGAGGKVKPIPVDCSVS